MKNRQKSISILITIVSMAFLGCEGMATLFHGPKPEPPPVTYTVTFIANGASGTPPAEQTVNTGSVIILPDKGSLSSSGNVFVGWNESASGGDITYSVGASVTVTRNMAFYAQWLDGSTPQYTVTFNANGATSGATPAPKTVYRGISITVPAQGTLAYSGKIFGGWNTQASGGGTNYAVGATFTVTGDVMLYAKWQSEVQYTVTYHANGASGAAPTAQTVDPGTVITLPGTGNMTNIGKIFNGWNTQANGGGASYAEGAAYTVNGNVTLYARWRSEIQYTVSYDANGAIGAAPSPQTEDPGTVITLPGTGSMTYTEKIFRGWNTQADGSGTNYAGGTAYTVNGNVTLYAKWSAITLGDTGPAGGLIFYDKGNNSGGWRYLEAAPANTEFTATWGNIASSNGNTSTDVGTGKNNTQILSTLFEQKGELTRAAIRCTHLNINGFTDWFLPSKAELAYMYINLKERGLGDFGKDYYWSSSITLGVGGWYSAWAQRFSDGSEQGGMVHNQSQTYSVRACRQF